jgi:hypothetical protein
MKYAVVHQERTTPSPGARGSCPACGGEVLAKCGKRLVWHWSHMSLRHCDLWWENETQWHREWKSQYPSEWQEVVQFDELLGEKHIADVKTPHGLVLEFQNSPMSSSELLSREKFYGNMIWIVNGTTFKSNFHILHPLPNPEADFVKDLVFFPRKHNHAGMAFHRRSEKLENSILVEIHGMHKIQEQVNQTYKGHHVFDWVRAKYVWFEAAMPVYFDFGDSLLWRLDKTYQENLPCVQAVSKREFIFETGGNVQPRIG